MNRSARHDRRDVEGRCHLIEAGGRRRILQVLRRRQDRCDPVRIDVERSRSLVPVRDVPLRHVQLAQRKGQGPGRLQRLSATGHPPDSESCLVLHPFELQLRPECRRIRCVVEVSRRRPWTFPRRKPMFRRSTTTPAKSGSGISRAGRTRTTPTIRAWETVDIRPSCMRSDMLSVSSTGIRITRTSTWGRVSASIRYAGLGSSAARCGRARLVAHDLQIDTGVPTRSNMFEATPSNRTCNSTSPRSSICMERIFRLIAGIRSIAGANAQANSSSTDNHREFPLPTGSR